MKSSPVIAIVVFLAWSVVWPGNGSADFAHGAELTLQQVADEKTPAEQQQQQPVMLTVKRGLTAKLHFKYRDANLRSLANQSMDAEVLVRVERVSPMTSISEAENSYTLWVFGAVVGEYDLSDWVTQQDGSPLVGDDALPAMNIRVVSQLPPDQGTSLYEIDDPSLSVRHGYRTLLALIALLWALVPVLWLVVWWRSRVPVEPPSVVRVPTLADKLRPLVQRASDGELTIDEQSRMELLLYVFWQRRLGLPESLVDALPMLRCHDQSGGLLRALEACIHADSQDRPQLSEATMNELLAPYHAMCEDELRLQQIEALEEVA